MDWHAGASNGTRSLDRDLGAVISVTAAMERGGAGKLRAMEPDWSLNRRWFACRAKVKDAASEWAATIAERHVGFLYRRPQPHLATTWTIHSSAELETARLEAKDAA